MSGNYPVQFADSQGDSQAGGQLRTNADDHGLPRLMTELVRALTDSYGRRPRGRQNRLRGAAEASWVCGYESGDGQPRVQLSLRIFPDAKAGRDATVSITSATP